MSNGMKNENSMVGILIGYYLSMSSLWEHSI